MALEELVIVSVDDHIIEPPDMWDQHLSIQHKAIKPEFLTRQDGTEYWSICGRQIENPGLNAAVGRAPEEYGMESERLDQMRRGCWDANDRIADMNANGVLASLNFPSFLGIDGSLFKKIENQDDAMALLRAANDWHIDEWCANHPGRHIPLGLIPWWNIPAAVEEVKRIARKGCHAVSICENPAFKGAPSIHNSVWEPLWRVLADNEMSINLHISTGAGSPLIGSADTPIDCWMVTGPGTIMFAAADWLYLDALDRYPNLKIFLTEGGLSWVLGFLERAEQVHRRHRLWTNSDFGPGRTPTDRFREHFMLCFIDDQFGIENLRHLGEDNVCVEVDYPHSDCVWPNSPELLWKALKHLPRATIEKLTHQNALKAFHFDPFTPMRGRKNCTVGALRALAKDVDTSLLSFKGVKPAGQLENRRVTCGDIVGQMASLNR